MRLRETACGILCAMWFGAVCLGAVCIGATWFGAMPPAMAADVFPTQAELDAADTDGSNWLTYNKGYLGYRYTSAAGITRTNAGAVKVLCTRRLDNTLSLETGPVVYGGVIYATIGLQTYAIDGATCALKWVETHDAPTYAHVVNRGLALDGGRLFRGTGDGHLVALDAATGAVVWDKPIMNAALGELATAAPIAWNGLVFIGKAGGDLGIQGEMMAYRASDGARVWGFNTIPNVHDFGSTTWPSAYSIEHGGGGTWTSFSLDEKRGLILLPVGNPGPDFHKEVRTPGSNLFTSAIVALDAKTGQLRWWHQLLAADDRDWDTTVVARIPAAHGLDLAAGAGKDGVLHVVSADTGKLLYTQKVVQNYLNTRTPVPTGTGLRLCPIGAVQWNGPSYSPATNDIYMGGIDWCAQAIQGPAPTYHPDHGYTGWANGNGTRDPVARAFGLINAFDATTGKLMWRVKTAALPLGGMIATGGGLLIAGELNGDVRFFDAATGASVATVNVGEAIGGGLASYVAGGKQRLAVAAGINSAVYGHNGAPTIVVLGVP